MTDAIEIWREFRVEYPIDRPFTLLNLSLFHPSAISDGYLGSPRYEDLIFPSQDYSSKRKYIAVTTTVTHMGVDIV